MNRCGNRDRVFAVAIENLIDNMKKEYPEGNWQGYIMRYLLKLYEEGMTDMTVSLSELDISCSRFPPVFKPGESVEKSTLSEYDRMVQCVINDYHMKVDSEVFRYKGEDFLKEFLYYVYAENHPEIELDLDQEFADASAKPSKFIAQELKTYKRTIPDNLKGLSDIGIATYFVYQNGLDTTDTASSKSCYDKFVLSKFLSTMDRSLLYKINTANEIYSSVSRELSCTLAYRLSMKDIISTPAAVLVYYYFYFMRRGIRVFNESQTIMAEAYVDEELSRLNLTLSDGDKRYDKRAVYVASCAEREYIYVTSPACNSFFSHISNFSSRLKDRKQVLGEIMKFENTTKGQEYTQYYTPDRWLQTYAYYSLNSKEFSKWVSIPEVAKQITEYRKVLPTMLYDASEAAVLLLKINEMTFKDTDSNYYKHTELLEALTLPDLLSIKEEYGDFVKVMDNVKKNLSRFADEYWLQPCTEYSAVHLLNRCIMTVVKYESEDKVPILNVVDNPTYFRLKIEDTIRKLYRHKTCFTSMLSPTGKLVDCLLRCANGYIKINPNIEDISIELTDGDIEYFRCARSMSEEDLKGALCDIMYIEDLSKYGIYTDIRNLTDIDKIRASIWYYIE